MEPDYREIGRRVRVRRKALGMPQERLAELSDLSTPHMSHIETGSTKVSLPTLVRVANVLGCTVDELLCDSLAEAGAVFEGELAQELADCTGEELRVITATVKALKASLRLRGKRG